jgi:glycosyltransferase involved in cell wall biosynthesis
MRVLYLMGKAPRPISSGDALRNWVLLQATRSIATQLDLITLPQAPGPGVASGLAEVQAICDRATVVGRPIGRVLSAPVNRALTLAGRPYYHASGNLPDVRRAVREHLRGTTYDLVVLSQLYLGSALPDDVLPRTVYDTHNVHHLRLGEGLARVPGLPRVLQDRVLAKVQAQETRLLRRVPLTIACSAPDAAALQEMCPQARIELVPNGVEVAERTDRPAGTGSRPLFLASLDATPNIEGLEYLVDRVLPALRADIRVAVAGSNPRPSVRAILDRAGDRVEFLGQVPDARATMRSARALLVPLLTGGGTRLKVLEAFAVGLPVVTTSKGVEGIPARHGVHALVADSPAAFADAITSVVDAPDGRTDLAENAHRLVAAEYDQNALGVRFAKLLSEISGQVR